MTRLRPALASVLVLIALSTAGAWWYLYAPDSVPAAELVPGDTVAFATIPNAVEIAGGYPSSQLKQLVDAPETGPILDQLTALLGQKNLELIQALLPSLSGQSFIAVTHFDPAQPEQVGLIVGMKPKPGLGDFNAFIEKLKATYPEFLKQGTTGTGSVAGIDYQWIQGPGARDKICVAHLDGWTVTSWGPATLQDWVERLRKKSSSPSLAQNPDYQKSIDRVGKDAMTFLYLNSRVTGILHEEMAPYNTAVGNFLSRKLAGTTAAIGTRFEQGEIVDRFSFLNASPSENGFSLIPCPFDTLKFTGPNTRLYWAASFNWSETYKNLQAESARSPQLNPMGAYLLNALQAWAQSENLDVQRNILDPLGSEISVQAEWSDETSYPEAGLYLKLEKPDDFKPVIAAIVDSVQKYYATSSVVEEIESGGHHFATLKFVQPLPVNPTILEDGSYLGLFLTENQAVRSVERDESVGLLHNVNFTRQVGDRRNGAAQIVYLDTPDVLNRSYAIAMPYLSLASMFMPNLAAWTKGHDFPKDLAWLAPVGAWSFVLAPDAGGTNACSVSGVGNQGIFLGGALGGAFSMAQTMGYLPQWNRAAAAQPPPPAPTAPVPTGIPAATNSPAAMPPPPAPDANATTNAPPAAAHSDATPPGSPAPPDATKGP